MSKQRALRRAEREAQQAKERAARARRDRRRALLRAITPRLPDRRTGRLFARRGPGERAVIAVVALGLLGAIWLLVPAWPLRIALTLLLVLALPALVIMAFDRRV